MKKKNKQMIKKIISACIAFTLILSLFFPLITYMTSK